MNLSPESVALVEKQLRERFPDGDIDVVNVPGAVRIEVHTPDSDLNRDCRNGRTEYRRAVGPQCLKPVRGLYARPEVSQAITGITLSNTLHNLGLLRVSLAVTVSTGTDPMFGEAWSKTAVATSTKVAVNVQTAPLGATHQWFALFDINGNCVAATADAGVTQWGTGYQTFTWASPVTLVPGALYFVDAVNNGSTAANLSGVATLAGEVNGALAANNEPFSSCVCLADLQYVDGLGELSGAPGAAAELA